MSNRRNLIIANSGGGVEFKEWLYTGYKNGVAQIGNIPKECFTDISYVSFIVKQYSRGNSTCFININVNNSQYSKIGIYCTSDGRVFNQGLIRTTGNLGGNRLYVDSSVKEDNYYLITATQARLMSNFEYTSDSDNNYFFEQGYYATYIKIKKLTFMKSDLTIVSDFRPAIVGGEAGMYETVSKKFFTNTSEVGELICE